VCARVRAIVCVHVRVCIEIDIIGLSAFFQRRDIPNAVVHHNAVVRAITNIYLFVCVSVFVCACTSRFKLTDFHHLELHCRQPSAIIENQNIIK